MYVPYHFKITNIIKSGIDLVISRAAKDATSASKWDYVCYILGNQLWHKVQPIMFPNAGLPGKKHPYPLLMPRYMEVEGHFQIVWLPGFETKCCRQSDRSDRLIIAWSS